MRHGLSHGQPKNITPSGGSIHVGVLLEKRLFGVLTFCAVYYYDFFFFAIHLFRFEGFDACGHACSTHELFSLHLQQQQHLVHYGHMDTHQASGPRQGAHDRQQVRTKLTLSYLFYIDQQSMFDIYTNLKLI